MPSSPKTLYLVDGSNYVFRAYYAIRGLSTSKGFPTNALYGFTQMLTALVRDEKPDYIAVVFDRPEPTFRDEMYPAYKANRKEPPDDLVQQFPFVVPLVKALGIAALEKPGFEADDIIGTIAKRFAAADLDVVLVSGDKDLMQLVDEHISILDTMKGKRVGTNDVMERFGTPPAGVVDVLGLAGDTSDNVPGLPGVGPKTAAKLIATYGSIENLVAHADRLKPGIRDKIREHLDQIKLSKELVTIKTDVDIDIALGAMIRHAPHDDELRRLFREFEFTKLLSELAPQKPMGRGAYRLIDEKSRLMDVVASIQQAGRVAVHPVYAEKGASGAELVGLALAWKPGEAVYLPMRHAALLQGPQLPERTVTAALKPLMGDEGINVYAHDAKMLKRLLSTLGISIAHLGGDMLLAAHLIDQSTQTELAELALRYLGHQMIAEASVVGSGAKRRSITEIDSESACEAACEAADVVVQLSDTLMPLVAAEGVGSLYTDVELPLIDVLGAMEDAGIMIDAARLKIISDDLAARLKGIQTDIFDRAGEEFNIMSPRQLGRILFEKLSLPGGKRTKTGFSTSQDVLEGLACKHRLPELILQYRQLSKLKSTYVDSLPLIIDPATGRIHTTFNQTATATGRLSSSDPNLQNIPIRRLEGRMIREAFVADDGCVFVDADYSQIELRVLAHLTEDATLIDAFARGIDVHAATAAGIFGVAPERVTDEQRAVGKTVNFATIYGQGAYGLSRQLKIDIVDAQSYIDGYFKNYPNVSRYRDRILEGARRDGFVTTLFGRRRRLPDIASSNGTLRALAERMAFNTVIQGTAADIIKRAMISIHRDLPSVSRGARMLVQVHDELLFEVPHDDAERVRDFVVEHMEKAASLAVALVVDAGIGGNWAAAH